MHILYLYWLYSTTAVFMWGIGTGSFAFLTGNVCNFLKWSWDTKGRCGVDTVLFELLDKSVLVSATHQKMLGQMFSFRKGDRFPTLHILPGTKSRNETPAPRPWVSGAEPWTSSYKPVLDMSLRVHAGPAGSRWRRQHWRTSRRGPRALLEQPRRTHRVSGQEPAR